MHFLCLHGAGSNSRIFEQQTAALRYELGDNHTYDFVEGVIPWKAAIQGSNEETFAYGDMHLAASCLQTYEDFQGYLKEEGPYDGVIGFSLGSEVALSILVDHYRRAVIQRGPPPFKLAVLFCNPESPCDIDALRQGRIEFLEPEQVGRVIEIPTTHIWGFADSSSQCGPLAKEFCNAENQSIYVHGRGHEIPTTARETIAMVNVIRRAIELANSS